MQFNLHHCEAATEYSMFLMVQESIDITLIPETSLNKSKIRELRAKDYCFFYIPTEGTKRACIATKSALLTAQSSETNP